MMKGARENILQAVGGTPIVKLQRMAADVAADIYVKCEYLNPGGSMKDRMALNMIDGAEKRGEIKPGGTIIEATKLHRTMAAELMNGPYSCRSLIRSSGQSSRLMYFAASRAIQSIPEAAAATAPKGRQR